MHRQNERLKKPQEGFIGLNSCGYELHISVLQVRAHYSLVSSLPCPALDKLCDEGNCIDQLISSPVIGVLPSPGWCLHQWQKTIPKNHTSTFQLG